MPLTHIDDEGHARMVDVGAKQPTRRRAVARATLVVGEWVMAAIEAGETPKGNVYETARIAAILGAKRTSDLIPLCHPLPLDHVEVDFTPAADRIEIEASAATRSPTTRVARATARRRVGCLSPTSTIRAWPSSSMWVRGMARFARRG